MSEKAKQEVYELATRLVLLKIEERSLWNKLNAIHRRILEIEQGLYKVTRGEQDER